MKFKADKKKMKSQDNHGDSLHETRVERNDDVHHWHPILLLILLLILVASGFAGMKLYHISQHLPHLSKQRLLSSQSHYSVIKSSNGTVIWGHNRNRELVANKHDISKNIKDALTSIEDRKFYQEGGVNYLRTLQAGITDLVHRNRNQGGSTLTEQLVKNSYFPTSPTDNKTIQRKIEEIMLSGKLNNKYSKNTIMQMYTNKVFMGSGIYGMKTAAKYYFDKPLRNISKTQAAILAGMVQSPTQYDPYSHPRIAKERRNTVLRAMFHNHKLTYRETKRLLKTPIQADVVPLKSKIASSENFEHNQLVADDYTQSTLKQLNKMKVNLNSQTVDIKTPLNISFQNKLYQIIHSHSIPYPSKKLNVAATVINNKTGQAVAQVGGRDKKMVSSFDQATSSERSTGSIIKPILDYAPAMDDLGWGSGHPVYDTHFDYPGTNSPVYDWDDQYQGKLTLARALMNSRNIPAIKTLHAVGLSRALKLAKLAGLSAKPFYSSAIGVNASVAQMASAYSSLADYGNRHDISYLQNLQVGRHKSHNVTTPIRQVMTPQTAFMLTKVLERVPQTHELGQDAKISDISQAGKSGTIGYPDGNAGYPKDAISDAWYVGYTKGYTMVVWTGYKNPKHYLRQKNANVSEIIYRKMMEYLSKHSNTSDWKSPGKLESFHKDNMKLYSFSNPNRISSPSLGGRKR